MIAKKDLSLPAGSIEYSLLSFNYRIKEEEGDDRSLKNNIISEELSILIITIFYTPFQCSYRKKSEYSNE
jgi:hypothetical protein